MTSGNQKVGGTANLVAGRDIVVSASVVSSRLVSAYDELLKPFFDASDARIQALFPEGVLSPVTPERQADFSSEKLFTSLTLLGLPVGVALHAIELAEAELEVADGAEDVLSTDAIRVAVARALYKYDALDTPETKKQYWGDKYVRRYGNPSQPLDVVNHDGSVEGFTYQYVLKSLLPEILTSVWGAEKFNHLRRLLVQDDMAAMADEIVAVVKNLNVYRIHHSLLLQLSKEIALQPPHPWLVASAFDSEAIEYDLGKASHHGASIREHFALESVESALYSFRETLHHSSSAILAYYGVFMGCGYMAPLHVLHRLLIHAEQNDSIDLSGAHTAHMRLDLRNVGHTLTELAVCTKFLRKNLGINCNSDAEHLDEAFARAETLLSIARDLVTPYLELGELQKARELDPSSEPELLATAKMAFGLIPGFLVSSDGSGTTWLAHEIDKSAFRDLKSRILLAPIFSAGEYVDSDSLAPWRDRINNTQLTNSVFFVTNARYSADCITYRDSLSRDGLVPLFLTIRELVEMALEPDPVGRLASLVLSTP